MTTKDIQSTEQPKIPRVPWNPWVGVLLVGVAFVLSQILAGTILLLYPASQHWSDTQTRQWLTGSVYGQFAFICIAEALILGGMYYFLRLYHTSFKIIGLIKPRWRDVAYGLLAVPVYYVLYLLSVALASLLFPGFNASQHQELGFNNIHGVLPLTLVFISLVVLPPISEEIVVRGFLYSSLKKALPTVLAVIGTSALFASAHLAEGGDSGPLYIAAVDTFILSLVLIYLREKTGSLWASITLHTIKNGVAFVALFVLHSS